MAAAPVAAAATATSALPSAAADATGAALRKAAPSNELGFNSEHRLRAENLAFDIDVWYRPLREHTFESVFLPLTVDEAAAIVRNYDVSWRGADPLTTLTPQDVHTLRALEARIDDALRKEPFSDGRGAFLRLCGRSPKDGEPLDRADVWRRYTSQVAQLEADTGEAPACGNTRLIAVSRTPTLHVTSGAAAMSLLLSSERVFLDMVDWLKYGEPEQIVLRRWERGMALEHEFRAFVSAGRITAVSQYDHYCFYPGLHRHRDVIKASIAQAWQRLHACVGQDSYCADFVVFPEAGTATLIEISPFLPCTGPALFSWVRDGDLLAGRVHPSSSGNGSVSVSGSVSGGVSGGGHGDSGGGAASSSSAAPNAAAVTAFELRLREGQREQLEDLVDVMWEDRWRPNAEVAGGRSPVQRYDHFWGAVLDAQADAVEPESPSRRWPPALAAAAAIATAAALYSQHADAGAHGAVPAVPPATALAAGMTVLLVLVALSLRRKGDWVSVDGVDERNATPPGAVTDDDVGRTELLFVYGTLKRGFHWHDKFLGNISGAQFVGVARTVDSMPLVVGDCGVPYLLGDLLPGRGHPDGVSGEVYRVPRGALRGMDDYEGVSKGYYARRRVMVLMDGCDQGIRAAAATEVWVYVLAVSSDDLRQRPFQHDYSRAMHDARYRPIEHILVKQQAYLRGHVSTWGLARPEDAPKYDAAVN